MVWLENLPDDWWKEYPSISHSPVCIQELNTELLFLIRSLLLETRTYARVCKRSRLLPIDFQNALDARNIHRSVNLTNNTKHSDESMITISSLLHQTDHLSSKIEQIQLTIHWLAIDGEQAITPENPPPTFMEENSLDQRPEKTNEKKIVPSQLMDKSPLLQKLFEMASSTKPRNKELQEHIHPLTKNNLTVKPTHPRHIPVRRSHINNSTLLSLQPSPPSLGHELSIEQQLYFKSLTELCFNGTDKQRTDTFHRLASDAALQPLLPRLLLFISKGIETNIHLNDLTFILQFLIILKMLTMNTFISFDKYLHSIIPSLLTCLVCIFDLPKNTNLSSTIDHVNSNNYSLIWLMREQASDLISYFEKRYSSIPYLTQRIVSIIKSNLNMNDTTTSYSIAYTGLRTLVLMDIQMHGSFVIDILRNYKKKKALEPDFDLDHIEQRTLFDQKIKELSEEYNFILEDL